MRKWLTDKISPFLLYNKKLPIRRYVLLQILLSNTGDKSFLDLVYDS